MTLYSRVKSRPSRGTLSSAENIFSRVGRGRLVKITIIMRGTTVNNKKSFKNVLCIVNQWYFDNFLEIFKSVIGFLCNIYESFDSICQNARYQRLIVLYVKTHFTEVYMFRFLNWKSQFAEVFSQFFLQGSHCYLILFYWQSRISQSATFWNMWQYVHWTLHSNTFTTILALCNNWIFFCFVITMYLL